VNIPRVASVLFLFVATATPLLAQDQPPPTTQPAGGAQDPALEPLRNKPDLSEPERGQVRQWVTQRVSSLVGKDASAARIAGEELRANLSGGEGFKRAYASICLEVFGGAIKKADLEPAARMLAIVNTFGSADAVSVLLDALPDERVGVRAAAVVGLRSLKDKIAAAGRDPFQKVVTALRDAGIKENSRETLRTIYIALDYSAVASAPEPKLATTALLDLLEARAKQLASADAKAQGADDAGLKIAATLSKNMDEAERKRLIAITGALLKYAVTQYTIGDPPLSKVYDKTGSHDMIELRNGVEKLVQVGEELLSALLKPQTAPAVAENMRRAKPIEMRNEWKKWVVVLQREAEQDFSIPDLPPEPAATDDTKSAGKATKDKDTKEKEKGKG
jgi:hypothetical protein